MSATAEDSTVRSANNDSFGVAGNEQDDVYTIDSIQTSTGNEVSTINSKQGTTSPHTLHPHDIHQPKHHSGPLLPSTDSLTVNEALPRSRSHTDLATMTAPKTTGRVGSVVTDGKVANGGRVATDGSLVNVYEQQRFSPKQVHVKPTSPRKMGQPTPQTMGQPTPRTMGQPTPQIVGKQMPQTVSQPTPPGSVTAAHSAYPLNHPFNITTPNITCHVHSPQPRTTSPQPHTTSTQPHSLPSQPYYHHSHLPRHGSSQPHNSNNFFENLSNQSPTLQYNSPHNTSSNASTKYTSSVTNTSSQTQPDGSDMESYNFYERSSHMHIPYHPNIPPVSVTSDMPPYSLNRPHSDNQVLNISSITPQPISRYQSMPTATHPSTMPSSNPMHVGSVPTSDAMHPPTDTHHMLSSVHSNPMHPGVSSAFKHPNHASRSQFPPNAIPQHMFDHGERRATSLPPEAEEQPMETYPRKTSSLPIDKSKSNLPNNFFDRDDVKILQKKDSGIPIMTEFKEYVASKINDQWYQFGVCLGFTRGDLDAIESKSDRSGPEHCFMNLFAQWEKCTDQSIKPCLWSTVVEVLQTFNTPQNAKLATEIHFKFVSPSTTSHPPSWNDSSLYTYPSSHDQYELTSLPSNINHQLSDTFSLPTNNSQSASSGYASMSTMQKLEDDSMSHGTQSMGSIGVSNGLQSLSSSSYNGPPLSAGNSSYLSSLNGGGMLYNSSLPTRPSLTISSPPPDSLNDDLTSLPSNISNQMPYHIRPQHYPPPQQGHAYSPQEMTGHEGLPGYSDRPIVTASNRTMPDDIRERHPIEEMTETSEEYLSFDSNQGSDLKSKETSWIELLQRYMKDLESKSVTTTVATHPPDSLTSDPEPPNNNKVEEVSVMKKELDKAYERISSLEVRVQDLTLQLNIEIPEDNEVAFMSPEKLRQEYLRIKELKKKAESQSMDAKQSAQRLVAENYRLKEELTQLKNDRDMLMSQLTKFKRKNNEREKYKAEQLEVMERVHEGVNLRFQQLHKAPKSEGLLSYQSFKTVEITPEKMWNVITTERSTWSIGHVVVVGLPCAGKTSLVRTLLETEVKGTIPKARGDKSIMELHEVVMRRDPLTGDTQWKTAANGLECAVNFLAGVVAKHCFHQKATPIFTTSQMLPVDLPGVTDPEIKEHFANVFKGVKTLIEKASKQNNLVELALSSPTFINLWDVGVNRALYQLLPGVASRCKRLVIVDVIDLERDVPSLYRPPDVLPNEAVKRGDKEIVMKLMSRLEYFLIFAGLKRWFNPDPKVSVSPEVAIIGTHTQSFASRDGGKHLKEAKQTLRNAIIHQATEMGIVDIIDPHIVTYCTNKRNADDLKNVKYTIEQLIQSQTTFQADIDAKCVFLRSLFYNSNQLVTNREQVVKKAFQCNILDDEQIEKCLLEYRNAGSIFYYPNLLPPPVRDDIIFDVMSCVEVLDKLFYLEYYKSKGIVSLVEQNSQDLELYKHGLLTESLAERVIGKGYCHTFLDYMISCDVCTIVEVSSQNLFFVPTVRTGFDASSPDELSMYIKCDLPFLQYDSLSLFPKFLHTVFKLPETYTVLKTTEFNTFSFNYHSSISSPPIKVRIIYRKNIVEIRVESFKTTINSCLISHIITLCTKVFNHLSTYQQGLHYKFCIMCPNTYQSTHHHYVPFYIGYQPIHKELFCNDCKGNVDAKAAACWLH